VFPTKFAILYTFANICALARRVHSAFDSRCLGASGLHAKCVDALNGENMPKPDLMCGACACSTMFLSGPWTHLKKMMEKGRIVATIIYFLSMFLTLFCAIHVRVRWSPLLA